jgi:hypothetical protein
MTKEIALEYISKLKITVLPSGCHVPNRYYGKENNTYTRVTIKRKRYVLARLVIVAFHNIDYYNSHIESRHLCNYPPCINKEHVIPGTTSDNTLDQVKSGTHNEASKARCPKCNSLYSKHSNGRLQLFSRRCLKCRNKRRNELRRINKSESI